MLTDNNIFYSNDVSKTSDYLKYYNKVKYEKRVMVWVAISPKGMTPVFIMLNGQGVNEHIYKEEW